MQVDELRTRIPDRRLAQAIQDLRAAEPQHVEDFDKQDVLAHEANAAWTVSYTTSRADEVEPHEPNAAWSVYYSTSRSDDED